jgi:hypothetical protein
MKSSLFLLPAVCLLAGGCGQQQSQPAKVGDNPLTAPADYLGAINKAQQKAVKTLGTASLDEAIKVFVAQENRNPKSLDELVTSGTLQKLPAAPNGMKFDYDPATGTVKVVPQK